MAVAELTAPFDELRDHWRGGGSPAVTLIEHGDYECLYSRAAYRSIQRLEGALGERLRFAFRHFPLTEIHPHAQAAAEAAEAAAAQGRFWQMHDLLYGRQQALEEQDLRAYADEVGLDLDRYERDIQEGTAAQYVIEHAATALASGARGTPTLFIDGVRYDGSYRPEPLREALESAGDR
jgi:formate-nitrite transporter family protein